MISSRATELSPQMLWSEDAEPAKIHEMFKYYKKHYEEEGYVVLSEFFNSDALDKVNKIVDEIWDNREQVSYPLVIDILSGPNCGQRMKLKEAPLETRHEVHKINDLFLCYDAVRDLVLNIHLRKILSLLLDGSPLICNSLNFIYGSQQPCHFDTWYMPPPVENCMAVASIALEDINASAGPLIYYPRSHHLEPYRFSHGGIHAVDAEMSACSAYIQQALEHHRLKEKIFIGRKGDVFIWHGQLFHGGSTITQSDKTRKSIVTHYWRAQDVEPSRVETHGNGGHYLKREHQSA